MSAQKFEPAALKVMSRGMSHRKGAVSLERIVFAGPATPLSQLLLDECRLHSRDVLHLSSSELDKGLMSSRKFGGDTPIVVLITWQDFVKTLPSEVISRRAKLIREFRHRHNNTGRLLVCTVPYGSYVAGVDVAEEFLTEGSAATASAHSWLQRDPGLWSPFCENACESMYLLLPMLVGLTGSVSPGYTSFFDKIIGTVRSLKLEVEDKAPGYFERYPLQLRTPPGSGPNAISPFGFWQCIEGASRSQLRQRPVSFQNPLTWSSFCDLVACSVGVPFSCAEPGANLTSLDELFNQLVRSNSDLSQVEVRHKAPANQIEVDAGLPQAVRDAVAQPLAEWESTYVAVTGLDLSNAPSLRRKHLSSRPQDPFLWEEARAGMRSYYAGGFGETLLLLPPFGVEARCYAMLAGELLRDHKVIIWEPQAQAAHANSGCPPISLHLSAIIDVLDSEDVAACHVIAWCSGAHLGAALASECKDRVRSLSLLTPGIFELQYGTSEYKSLVDFYTLLTEHPEDADRILSNTRAVLKGRPAWNLDQYLPREGNTVSPLQYNGGGYELINAILSDPARSLAWAAQSLRNLAGATSVAGELQRSSLPILSVLGTHDSLVDYAVVRDSCRSFQQWTLATILGGNHYLLIEHAPAVARLVRHFVRGNTTGGYRTDSTRSGRVILEHYLDTMCAEESYGGSEPWRHDGAE